MFVCVVGYANRECLVGGIWSEVDSRDCVSIRSQQFIADAESIDAGQVMNIYELHYSLSDITSYTSTSSVAVGEVGVSGGDLRAVGRYLMTVVQLLVKSAYGPATDDHRLLLEVSIYMRLERVCYTYIRVCVYVSNHNIM